jgi:hypothetical protein
VRIIRNNKNADLFTVKSLGFKGFIKHLACTFDDVIRPNSYRVGVSNATTNVISTAAGVREASLTMDDRMTGILDDGLASRHPSSCSESLVYISVLSYFAAGRGGKAPLLNLIGRWRWISINASTAFLCDWRLNELRCHSERGGEKGVVLPQHFRVESRPGITDLYEWFLEDSFWLLGRVPLVACACSSGNARIEVLDIHKMKPIGLRVLLARVDALRSGESCRTGWTLASLAMWLSGIKPISRDYWLWNYTTFTNVINLQVCDALWKTR